jgi:hypothetical protein
MEVHHHAHPASGHKKKWSHYFWEFLMLFLAVFCGFLAENQREHYVEKMREKQFMVSLVKDLELDTAQLNRIQRFRQNSLLTIDSLAIFFSTPHSGTLPFSIYAMIRSMLGSMYFFQNSGTLDQLKNSGGMRLIHHRRVVDSIESYDQQIRRIVVRDRFESEFGFDNTHLMGKLFKNSVALKIMTDTMYLGKTLAADQHIPFNDQYLDEYLNHLMAFQDLIKINLAVQLTTKTKVENLIALIKEEYHLK